MEASGRQPLDDCVCLVVCGKEAAGLGTLGLRSRLQTPSSPPPPPAVSASFGCKLSTPLHGPTPPGPPRPFQRSLSDQPEPPSNPASPACRRLRHPETSGPQHTPPRSDWHLESWSAHVLAVITPPSVRWGSEIDRFIHSFIHSFISPRFLGDFFFCC